MPRVKAIQSRMDRADPSVRLLRLLHRAGEDSVSGQAMADGLGCSRAAVWKRLSQLREIGYTIDAAPRRGYRLAAGPEDWTAPGILARLPESTPLEWLEVFEEIGSTNDEALRRLVGPERAPFACLTRVQPRGKGRRGRAWQGQARGNFYGTLGLRPDLSPEKLRLFPLLAGLRLADLFRERFGVAAELKWPNDLLLRGRKVAGILCESVADGERAHALAVGLGCNLNAPTEGLPAELRAHATSLAEERGRPVDTEEFAASVLEVLLGVWETIRREGAAEGEVADLWPRLAAYRDQPVRILRETDAEEGILAGIDATGALLLRRSDGSLRSFHAGDVSLREG